MEGVTLKSPCQGHFDRSRFVEESNCLIEGMMENGNVRRDTPGMRAGGQWTSSHCVEKVEEMLSRAIIHQEDLWGLLVKHAPLDESCTPGEAQGEESVIPPPLLKALKAKLENSLDWCHLALCRLKEIIVHTSSYPASHEEDEEETAAVVAGFARAPSLKVPSPLSALRVSKEPLSSYPFTNAGRFHSEWSPGSFIFLNESSQMPSRSAQTCDGEQLQESMDLIVPDGEHHQQGQRFVRLPSLGFDSDWKMLAAEAQACVLPAAASPRARSAPGTETHQSSSSCPLNAPDVSENGVENEGRNLVTKLNSRDLRPRCGPKRDREENDEKDTTVTVVFQELKPGNDTKKGIPDDGHRGWKKYGNKTIQNSNFCRGYYKCSTKDCRAKKMVQLTDKNPSIFEVTYVGNHTCSSTFRRRIRSRTSNSTIPRVEQQHSTADGSADIPVSGGVLVQTKLARLLKNQAESALLTEADRSTGDGNYEPDLQRLEKSWPSPEIQTAEEELPDIGNAADSKEACSLEDLDEDDESSRDERLGFAFPSDSLLWQEIMSNNHKEVWNSLEVEI